MARTAKLYIGGKQARPDGGYSLAVVSPSGKRVGEVAVGNRKDLRNAVEAARAAQAAWGNTSGHGRAQILYYLAENLNARADEFAQRLRDQTGMTATEASAEVDGAVQDLFRAAAWADKHDGVVHSVPMRAVTMAVPEPLGVVGIVLPDRHPLRGLTALAAKALAQGNAVVVVPGASAPLTATDFYQVLDTSDVPGGVFNLVTGPRDELAKTLAEHDDVDGIWYAGPQEGRALVEAASIHNMKRTWTMPEDASIPATDETLRQATQVKNIWVPYGA